MNWYLKITNATARDMKANQIENWVNRLQEAVKGSAIDKENSKDIVENVIERINGKGERSLLPMSLKKELRKMLRMAINSILDSPSRFDAIVDEAIFLLEDHLLMLKQ
jgi:hypothetical protein